MVEADVFQNDDGRVVVTMRHPPTFDRSVDCFLKAIQYETALNIVFCQENNFEYYFFSETHIGYQIFYF